nr:MAG TPA: hypothetical protein [Caudoviricetes sp.]
MLLGIFLWTSIYATLAHVMFAIFSWGNLGEILGKKRLK